MGKSYSLFRLPLVVASSIVMSAHGQTPTVVFSDNFDRASFTTGSTGGSPATTYTFSTGGSYTLGTTLVSGSNYKVQFGLPNANQKALFVAPLSPYSAPFSRQLNLNVGLVTWTFNMRSSAAVGANFPASGTVAGGVDLCGNKANNIYNGAPTGYGVVFNSGATGGVNLIRFNSGMNSGTVLITQTTTMPKTDYYSVRVTYDPSNNHWQLFVRDDGASGFSDPSSGVTLQQGSTITDATYTAQVMTNFGAVSTSANTGAGRTMNFDNFKVQVLVPPCGTPVAPTGLSFSNTATTSIVTFTPPTPRPTGYILVASSGPLSGLPSAGQAVSLGTAVGSNGTIVATGTGTSTSITASSLTANTSYTFTLFPYNNTGCTGGPVFNTSLPSTTITTCPNAPSLTGVGTPTSNMIPGVTWSAPAAGGGVYSTYTYLLNVYTDAALTIPAAGYPLSGTVVTGPYDITGLTSGVTYYYTITAVDSACNSSPSSPDNQTTSVVPCSGTPVAGASTSTSTSVIGSAPFTLGLSGASGETGITFKWQSSACLGSWSDLSGVSSSYNYSTSESANMFYRCVVTCSNSGLSSSSAPIYVGHTATPYCYPSSTNGCSGGDGVNSFTLNGECGTSINDPGPIVCGATNTDHTNYAPVKLYAGSNYAATVNSNFDGDDVYVWIDFDNSGTFDASEIVYSTNTAPVPALPFFYSFNVPIPGITAGAQPGLHRMRVVVNQSQTLSTGCDALTFGTSADYMCQILANLSLNYNSPLCLPSALTLTAAPSITCGATYSWSGPSGYSNTTINTNTVSPPVVAGVYTVAVSVNGVSSCPTSIVTTSVNIFTAPVITGISGMCVGSTATMTSSLSGGAWTSGNTGVASVGSSTGLVTGVAFGSARISYTVTSSGCVGTSTMNVTPTPAVFNVTGGGVYCTGGSGVHVGLSNSGSGVSYQLYNGGVATGSPVTGIGGSIDFGAQTVAGNYTVVANPGSSCATNMNGTVSVVVSPLPVNYALTGGGSYCPGGPGVVVGLAGSDTGVTYQLSTGSTLIGSPVPGTGTSLNFGMQTTVGYYTVLALTPGTGCSQYMSPSVAVSLKPLPDIYTVSGGGAYCAGGAGIDIGLANSSSDATYMLYLGGLPVGGALTGTGTALDFGLQTGAGVYTIVGTSSITTCSVNMLGSATVTINPTPDVFNVTGGASYCTGGTGVHIGLNGSALGINYLLYEGSAVVGGASGTSAPVDFGLETGAGTYTVVATNTTTGCSASMNGSATVVINPLPLAVNVTGGGGYCAGAAGVHIGLDGTEDAISYQLLDAGLPVIPAVTGSGFPVDFGTFTTSGIYTVVATNPTTGCTNTMNGNAVVSINPLPVIHSITGGGSYCAGGTGISIGLNGSDVGISYQLQSGTVAVGVAIAGTGSLLDFGAQTAAGGYTVTATNSSTGCTNVMAGGAAITINPAPAAFTVAGGGNFCLGGSGVPIMLGNSAAGVNYQLYLGSIAVGSPLAGTGTPLSFGMQTGTGIYTVTASNPVTGCTSIMSGSAAVGITPLPSAFTVTGGGSYCAGGAGAHVGLSSSAPGINYQLYNGSAVGSPVGGTGLPIDFGAQIAAGTYTVIATDTVAGCLNNMSGSAAVTISALPVAYTLTGGGGYCAGGAGVPVGLAGSTPGITYQLYIGAAGVGTPLTGSGGALDFGLQTTLGSYTIQGTDGTTGCTNNMAGTAVVTSGALPALHSVTGGGNYCIGGTGVNIGLDGTEAGINYQLYLGSAAVGSPVAGGGLPISFGSQTSTGIYTVHAANGATGCNIDMSGSALVSVSATPVVYAVTGGGNYCASGSGVLVGLGGSDPGVSYQLYNGSALGSPVMGTGSAISFGLQTASGAYTVIASGSTPSCIATMSGTASVGVAPGPLDHNLTGGGSYCADGAGTLVGLDMADAGVSYQLYVGTTPTGVPINGGGSPISFGAQTATGTYTVKATLGSSGCIATMPSSTTVAVTPVPATYSMTGGGGYCAGGAGASVVLGGSQPGVNYQLYNGSSTVGVPVPGTGASLDFGPQPAGVYTVKATDAGTACTSSMSGSAVVSVNPLPAAFPITGGGAYCIGGAGVDVQLGGSAAGVRYQLYHGAAPDGATVSGTGLPIDFGNKTAGGAYTVTATDVATGCINIMTGTATVTANPLPNVYTLSGSGSAYCAGDAGIIVSLAGSQSGVTYQLYHNGNPIGTGLPGSGLSLSFGPQTFAGTYSAVATNGGCTANMTGGATISINPVPDAFSVTGGGAYCAGGTGVHISLSGSVSGIQYQLYQGTSSVGTSITGTGGSLDFGLQTGAGNYTVKATNPGTGCGNTMTGSRIIGINPLPGAQTVTGGGSYCAGGAGLNIGIGSSVAGVNYQLYLSSTPVGTVAYGSGTALNFGHQAVAGVYTVKATDAITGCTNAMTGSASVAINALPAAYLVSGGGGYCIGGAGVHVGLSNSNHGVRYQLYYGTAAIGSAVSGTGSALDMGLQTGAGTYTIAATDSATGCVNNMAGSAIVNINPLPAVYTVTGGGHYCAGGSGVHVGLSNSVAGTDYTLYSGSAIRTLHGGGILDFGLQTLAGAYTIMAVNVATGCTNTMAGTATVAMDAAVIPSVTVNSSEGANGCTGRASTFTAMPVNGGSAPVYQWSINGTVVGAGNTYTYIPLNGDVVAVIMTSNAACASPLTAGGSTTMTVSTVEAPSALITSDHGTDVCDGTAVAYTAMPAFGGSAPSYTWLVNGTVNSGSSTSVFDYVPANGDVISCVLHSNYHCRLHDTGLSNSLTMATAPVLTPTVTITASDNGSQAPGVQVVLTATAVNAGPSPAYQWYVNGIAVPGATLPVFTGKVFADLDDVTCKVTSDGPCGGTGSASITLHVWNVGVREISSSEGSLRVMPNPSAGTFIIAGNTGSAMEESAEIEITDLLGRSIYKDAALTKGGKLGVQVSLGSDVANGMYLVTIHTQSIHATSHVVIKR